MSIDDESWAKFVTPWEFDNLHGIPEVPIEDIQEVTSFLGRGKKGSTRIAIWKGEKIALKSWVDGTGYDAGPYSEWEILNYCRLKALQGSLIPKLLFVSRTATGKRVIGLELGKPIGRCSESEMEATNENLAKHGWMQRSGSVRPDNFVRMGQEARLVAIDLESFIPVFSNSHNHALPSPTISHGSILGIPIVEPSEVEIEGCIQVWEWSTKTTCRYYPKDAMWGATKVSLHSYDYAEDAESLKLLLERNVLLEKAQGSLIITPLFLARERNGTIILGYKRFRRIYSREDIDATKEVVEDLIKLGWTIPEEDKYEGNFCKLDDKILLHNLSCLLPNEDPPDMECVSMSSSSQEPANSADEASPHLPLSVTLRPLPHRTNQVSSPDKLSLTMTLRPLPHRINQASFPDSEGKM